LATLSVSCDLFAPFAGAPQQPQQGAFGGGSTFAFGAGVAAPPAAPAMIPNNPFGSGMGGGFSMGSSGGGSQSESARRKVKVKRPGRK